jgi:hypothetical protein
MKVVKEEELVAVTSQDTITEGMSSAAASLEKSSMYTYKEDH